jgi:hypothetical protein
MTPRKLWTIAAWLFTAGAGAAACALPFLKWVPQAPFDILGFMWLLTNTPNLFLWTATIALGVLALYYWAKAVLAGER